MQTISEEVGERLALFFVTSKKGFRKNPGQQGLGLKSAWDSWFRVWGTWLKGVGGTALVCWAGTVLPCPKKTSWSKALPSLFRQLGMEPLKWCCRELFPGVFCSFLAQPEISVCICDLSTNLLGITGFRPLFYQSHWFPEVLEPGILSMCCEPRFGCMPGRCLKRYF